MTNFRKTRGADVHSHLQNGSGGAETLRSVLLRASEAGIDRIVCCATRPSDFEAVRRIGSGEAFSIKSENDASFPQMIPTYGIHPWFCDRDFGPEEENLLISALTGPITAGENGFLPGVGEIGLDFTLRGLDEAGKRRQREVFRRQLEIADRLGRPVILHSVRSGREIEEILPSFSNIPLVLFHGFTDFSPLAVRDDRVFFSFSEREIRPKNLKGIAAVRLTADAAPERILVESDYPSTQSEPGVLAETERRLTETVGWPAGGGTTVFRRNETAFFRRWPRNFAVKEIGRNPETANSEKTPGGGIPNVRMQSDGPPCDERTALS